MGKHSAQKLVLIVEDNLLNRKLARDLLIHQGYAVIETGDGLEALTLAREHHPDLILMDIQLPDVSGLEVTQWIKADEDLQSIPVIALTAFAMITDEEKFRGAGCDDYIAKPMSLPDFLDKVARYLA